MGVRESGAVLRFWRSLQRFGMSLYLFFTRLMLYIFSSSLFIYAFIMYG
jgi:hypothetical protein